MENVHSDALVFYGATGDLAYKKIFPALQSMVRHDRLRVPIRDEKARVLKAIAPIRTEDLVRAQFRDYHSEKGLHPGSQTETFAALRLEIDCWRWKGVPFCIRAGKYMPVTRMLVAPPGGWHNLAASTPEIARTTDRAA